MSEAKLHALISGRVQGVGFRFSTRDHANRLGLEGWVRNLDDGRVEAEYSGNREALETLLAWFEEGPPMARVDRVDARWED